MKKRRKTSNVLKQIMVLLLFSALLFTTSFTVFAIDTEMVCDKEKSQCTEEQEVEESVSCDEYDLGDGFGLVDDIALPLSIPERNKTKTSLKVIKQWSDDQFPLNESVTVTLWKTGNDGISQSTGRTLTLSQENNWQGVFDNLDIPKEGKEFAYTVVEEQIDGYTSKYGPIEKVPDSWRPSQDNSLQDGKTYVFRVKDPEVIDAVLDHTQEKLLTRGTITVNTDGTIVDVPASAMWTVRYRSQDKGDGFIFSNYYNGTFHMQGEHCVEHESDAKVNQYIPPEDRIFYVESAKTYLEYSEHDQKYYTREDKDEFAGKIDKFVLYELDPISGTYQTVIRNEKVETPATTSLKVKKEWADGDDGQSPVTIALYKKSVEGDMKPTGRELVLNAENGWQGVFEGLELPNGDEEFPYSIVENPIAGYTAEYGPITKVDAESSSSGEWIKKDTQDLEDGKTYVFKVRNLPDVLTHETYTTGHKHMTRGKVTVNDDGTLSNVPEYAKWTVRFKRQDKGEGFIFENKSASGSVYIKGEQIVENEADAKVNQYISSQDSEYDGTIFYVESTKSYLHYQSHDGRYYLREEAQRTDYPFEHFDIYEEFHGQNSGNKPVAYETSVINHKNAVTAKTNLNIIKISAADNSLLSGAIFDIYEQVDQNISGAENIPGMSGVFGIRKYSSISTDNNGQSDAIELKLGNYYIVETSAPVGFAVLQKPIAVEVTNEGPIITLGSTTLSDMAFLENKDSATDWNLIVKNKIAGKLPATGEGGDWCFIVTGGLLIMFGIFQNRKTFYQL